MGEAMRKSEDSDWRDLLVDDDERLRTILGSLRRIAVIGLKAERRSWEAAHFVPRYMQEVGYEVLGVNPLVEQSLGHEVVDRLEQIEGRIDIVNVFRRSENIPAHVDEVLALPELPRVFWMQIGIRHEAAARRLAEAGIQVVQDRCILVEHRRLIAGAR